MPAPDSQNPKLDPLRAALAASPENVPLLIHFAHACIDEWALDEARDAFSRAREIQPESPEAALGMAQVLFLSGSTSEAAVRAEQLVAQQPDFAPARLLLSRILAAEGNRGDALSHYNAAVAISPNAQDAALAQELGIEPAGSGESPRPARRGRLRETGHGTFLDQDADDGDDDEESYGDDDFGDDDDDEPEFRAAPRADGIFERERPKITFEDVGGMDALKEQIRMKILYPMENPDLFKAYGKTIGGGVLLYGPPGCGKTLISRATAGEIKANFFAIGLHDVLDAFIGESEKRLHGIFETARQNAPAVLFFDEIDALAADRRDLRQSAARTVINQFLSELGGEQHSNDGILVLGATNAPWHIDSAFRRPGRFDRTIFVPPPDEPGRATILSILLRGKPIGDIDIGALAKKTRDFSGADLKAIIDAAVEGALEQAMSQGRIVPLRTKELVRAAKQTKPSTRAWFESARNYALYANQGGYYDDVLDYLGIGRKG